MQGQSIQVFGDGESVRDYVHVDDVVDAHSRVVDPLHSDPCSVFNIGTGVGTTPLKLIRLLMNAIGAEFTSATCVEHLSARGGEADSSILSSAKARRQLKWNPSFDLHSGIESVIDSLPNTETCRAESTPV